MRGILVFVGLFSEILFLFCFLSSFLSLRAFWGAEICHLRKAAGENILLRARKERLREILGFGISFDLSRDGTYFL